MCPTRDRGERGQLADRQAAARVLQQRRARGGGCLDAATPRFNAIDVNDTFANYRRADQLAARG